MKFIGIIFLLIILSVAEIQSLASSETENFEQTGEPPQVFYVSKRGNNTTGLSWATAWTELARIRWNLVRPGATIYIDGGGTRMVYRTTMTFGASGSAAAPINIQASTETGRNGQIIFFGGRNNLLPYCGQASYQNQADSTMRIHAIVSNGHDYINLNGLRWRGIRMHGYRDSAIRLDPDSRNLTFEYIEIHNNGAAIRERRKWYPEHPGVRLAGQYITFRHAIVHDNGQDAFQSLHSNNDIAFFRLERSWLYNGRTHPTVPESSNYCTHTDGIQLYAGGVVSDLNVVESVLGPGFTQNVMMGQVETSSGQWADVQRLVFRDVVFSRGADNGVVAYNNTNSQNWLLVRVTIDCRNTKYHCLRINNANHIIRNSIISDGRITLEDGLETSLRNCTMNTTGFDLGQEMSRVFADVSTTGMFFLDDYALDDSAIGLCVGSRITSAEQLLSE